MLCFFQPSHPYFHSFQFFLNPFIWVFIHFFCFLPLISLVHLLSSLLSHKTLALVLESGRLCTSHTLLLPLIFSAPCTFGEDTRTRSWPAEAIYLCGSPGPARGRDPACPCQIPAWAAAFCQTGPHLLRPTFLTIKLPPASSARRQHRPAPCGTGPQAVQQECPPCASAAPGPPALARGQDPARARRWSDSDHLTITMTTGSADIHASVLTTTFPATIAASSLGTHGRTLQISQGEPGTVLLISRTQQVAARHFCPSGGAYLKSMVSALPLETNWQAVLATLRGRSCMVKGKILNQRWDMEVKNSIQILKKMRFWAFRLLSKV